MSNDFDIQISTALVSLHSAIDRMRLEQKRLAKQHERDAQALARAGFALADCGAILDKLYKNIQGVLIENDELGILAMKVEPEDSYQRGFMEIAQLVNESVNKNE